MDHYYVAATVNKGDNTYDLTWEIVEAENPWLAVLKVQRSLCPDDPEAVSVVGVTSLPIPSGSILVTYQSLQQGPSPLPGTRILGVGYGHANVPVTESFDSEVNIHQLELLLKTRLSIRGKILITHMFSY